MKRTVLITGGHISPAIALIQELSRREDYSIHFIGRRYAFSEAKDRTSFEYETITSFSIPFTDLQSPRFPSRMSRKTMLFPFILLSKIITAAKILRKIRQFVEGKYRGCCPHPHRKTDRVHTDRHFL